MTSIYIDDKGKCVQFTCEKCGEHKLEEVMTDVVVTSNINSIGESGNIDYGEQCNEDGEVECYQCSNCGHRLPYADPEELYNYLTGHED